ncbi:hypothetical protein HPB50_007107 [Hyalomma asiaticum]|uniref:Uncharacterized protein n=1 Tax=Hyalomma asiaticum TaxID=266040 RepID=A0ACB7RSS8_HYAAI|nr:hypothetical protein HPB50_007107 [Hyalomma asiaticum]
MEEYQRAQVRMLLKFISSTSSCVPPHTFFDHFVCSTLLVRATCNARLLPYAIKNSYLPPSLAQLVGFFQPSKSHALRLCRILRSET